MRKYTRLAGIPTLRHNIRAMSQILTRREFLKAGVALSALPLASMVHAQGSDRIKVGLVGCGGRGTGAAIDCLRADDGTVIWAMGDIFEDRLNASYEGLKEQFPDRVQVAPERRFLGFDAYKKVLESGIDLVLLCTPPAFRPIHFLAAVEAGKHVFMEKPVAVCPEGVRMVLRGGEIAQQKRLGVMPGTQYRWHPGYQGVIERIRAGHIGEIRAAYAYYNAASPAPRPREAGWSDMVYQLRNWLFYTWLAGDQPVEQFVHNIDVMNWVMAACPFGRWRWAAGRHAPPPNTAMCTTTSPSSTSTPTACACWRCAARWTTPPTESPTQSSARKDKP